MFLFFILFDIIMESFCFVFFFFFRPPRLRAEQFVPGNQEHINVLKAMGITVIQTKDGRIKLMQTASTVRLED